MPIALIILPNFLLIILGFALHRWGGFPRAFWAQVERLIYFLLFPALLFRALAKTPIDLGTAAPLVLAGLLTMCSGMALSFLAKYLFKPSSMLFASGFQCAFRPRDCQRLGRPGGHRRARIAGRHDDTAGECRIRVGAGKTRRRQCATRANS
jgi:hypothetical protein